MFTPTPAFVGEKSLILFFLFTFLFWYYIIILGGEYEKED